MNKKDIRRELNNKSLRELKDIIVELKIKYEIGDNKEIKKRVMERDCHKCVLCGEQEDLKLHHFKPRILGGETSFNNLIVLCQYCHWYLHANPKFRISHSNLIRKSMIYENGVAKSYKGNVWGRARISKDMILTVRRLREQGKSYSQIAKEANVSKGTVHKILAGSYKNTE